MSIYSLQKEDLAELLRRNLNDRDFAHELRLIADTVDDEYEDPTGLDEYVRVKKEETWEGAEVETLADHIADSGDTAVLDAIERWVKYKTSDDSDLFDWVEAIFDKTKRLRNESLHFDLKELFEKLTYAKTRGEVFQALHDFADPNVTLDAWMKLREKREVADDAPCDWILTIFQGLPDYPSDPKERLDRREIIEMFYESMKG